MTGPQGDMHHPVKRAQTPPSCWAECEVIGLLESINHITFICNYFYNQIKNNLKLVSKVIFPIKKTPNVHQQLLSRCEDLIICLMWEEIDHFYIWHCWTSTWTWSRSPTLNTNLWIFVRLFNTFWAHSSVRCCFPVVRFHLWPFCRMIKHFREPQRTIPFFFFLSSLNNVMIILFISLNRHLMYQMSENREKWPS